MTQETEEEESGKVSAQRKKWWRGIQEERGGGLILWYHWRKKKKYGSAKVAFKLLSYCSVAWRKKEEWTAQCQLMDGRQDAVTAQGWAQAACWTFPVRHRFQGPVGSFLDSSLADCWWRFQPWIHAFKGRCPNIAISCVVWGLFGFFFCFVCLFASLFVSLFVVVVNVLDGRSCESLYLASYHHIQA